MPANSVRDGSFGNLASRIAGSNEVSAMKHRGFAPRYNPAGCRIVVKRPGGATQKEARKPIGIRPAPIAGRFGINFGSNFGLKDPKV
jgi:hypothetical protein